MKKHLFYFCGITLTSFISNANCNHFDYYKLGSDVVEKSIMDKINNDYRLKEILNNIRELACKINKAYKEGKDESKYLFQFSEKIMQLQSSFLAKYGSESNEAILLLYNYQLYTKTGNNINNPNDFNDFLSADFIKISSKLPGLFPSFCFRCTSNNILRFFGE